MSERWHNEAWAKDMWWSGKTTRRKFLALSSAYIAVRSFRKRGARLQTQLVTNRSEPE